jgi:hypothetical protein
MHAESRLSQHSLKMCGKGLHIQRSVFRDESRGWRIDWGVGGIAALSFDWRQLFA